MTVRGTRDLWILLAPLLLAGACAASQRPTDPTPAPAAVPAPATAPAWQAEIQLAAGGARKGPWRMNRSAFHYVDDSGVAIDDDGVVGVVWADNALLDVFFQVYSPDGRPRLPAPVNVARSPATFSWLPRLLIAGADAREVYALWQEIVFSGGSHGGEIFFARSRDGGRSFETPLNLSNSRPGDGKGRLTRPRWDNGSLDLAMGPRGTLYAAWTEFDGRLWLRRSADGGASFAAPLHLAGDDSRPARGPALAVGPSGAVHLAWTVGEDRRADIRLARSDDGGRSFDAPRVVAVTGGHSDAPKLAAAGDGTLHLVYAESASGPFGRSAIRYSRRPAAGAAWEPPREISRPHPVPVESVAFPHLALDADGTVYVAWELHPDLGGYPRGLAMTWSRDGGDSFAPPLLVPGGLDPARGITGSQQGLLMRKLAVNRNGDIAVVNSSFKRGERSAIWLLRGRLAP